MHIFDIDLLNVIINIVVWREARNHKFTAVVGKVLK
jgi:hypothetical protein